MMIEKLSINEETLKAFNEGYSDYIYKIPYLNKEAFIRHIMKANSNNAELCFSAFEDGRVIGIILAGCSGNITRISSLCVVPEYRSKGIAEKLMNFLVSMSPSSKFILEVEEENERALRFYKGYGFTNERRLMFLSGKCLDIFIKSPEGIYLREGDIKDAAELQPYIEGSVSWQNSIHCLLNKDIRIIICYINERTAGFIIFTEGEQLSIKQIYVEESMRRKGIGSRLVFEAARGRGTSCIVYAESSSEKFFKALGLKVLFSQDEMVFLRE